MCLGQELPPQSQEKIKREAKKRGYIRVYKTVLLRDGDKAKPRGFVAWWTHKSHKKGIQRAYGVETKTEGGWHAFRSRRSAEKSIYSASWRGKTIIECLALPEWIKNSGKYYSLKTILFTKLCFPEFPKRKVTIKEFKQYLAAVK